MHEALVWERETNFKKTVHDLKLNREKNRSKTSIGSKEAKVLMRMETVFCQKEAGGGGEKGPVGWTK